MRDLNIVRRLKIIGITIVIIATSFFRDHFFRSVNEQLRLNYYGLESYDYSFLRPFISSFSSEGLNNLKFILTLCFSGIFMLLSIALCHITFRNKRYNVYVAAAYIFVFLLSFSIYAGGKLTGKAQAGYELSRTVSEFLQSPLLILILMAVFVFDTKLKAQKQVIK